MGYGESNGHVTDDVAWLWNEGRGPIIFSALYLQINVKKLQFNHVLTTTCIDSHTENSKNDKKVILATITSTKCQCAGV